LIDWIIDEGVEGKKNRKNAMADHHKEIGVAMGPHPIYGFCTIILLANQIVAKDS